MRDVSAAQFVRQDRDKKLSALKAAIPSAASVIRAANRSPVTGLSQELVHGAAM
jgi:hypothetical protein